MRSVHVFLFCLFLKVSNAYGAAPEFYGIYADHNGKLYELSEKHGDTYEFGRKVQFLVFQKNAEVYANRLTIERAVFVRTVNNPGMDGRQPPKQVNQWKPRLNGAVETRTKPVNSQYEQIYVVPRNPLSPGVYIVRLRGDQEIGRFYVDKNLVMHNLQQGEDCIDIKVGSGWKSYEYDINGGGGVSTPCLASFSAIGRFSGNGTPSGLYAVELWRDPKVGIVGLLGYPVMEADTPTQVIESVKYSSTNGSLSFQATFLDPYVWDGPESVPPDDKDRERTIMKFSGTLEGKTLKGVFTSYRNNDNKPQGKGVRIELILDSENTDRTVYASLQNWREAQIQFGRIKVPPPALPSKEVLLNMAQQYGCFNCHDIDKKVVGPAWRDVATRYRNIAWAENQLVDKVRLGGAGAWGSMPEIPHTTMPPSDIRLLVQFILSL